MRSAALLRAIVLLHLWVFLVATQVSGHDRHSFYARKPHQRRQPDDAFEKAWSASNYQNGSTAPNAVPGDSAGQTLVIGGTGADDDSQRPGCDTAFVGTAQVSGSQDGGWQELPQVVGFDIDRNTSFGSAVMPIYVESGKDFSKVRRGEFILLCPSVLSFPFFIRDPGSTARCCYVIDTRVRDSGHCPAWKAKRFLEVLLALP